MKHKNDQYLNKWRSVFKVLPVKTEDGFTVWMERVYEKHTDDLLNPIVYHTNPLEQLLDNLDSFIAQHLPEEAAEVTTQINEIRDQAVKKSPLTEGKMMRRGSNPLPQFKRPPPPPPPPRPRGRRIGGEDITTNDILEAWDLKKKKKVCPKCGTTDCRSDTKMKVSSSCAISINPSDLLKSCKVRQQLKAMDKIKFGGPGKKLPKAQPLGKYTTGSTGPK